MLAAAGSNEIRIWDPKAAVLDGNDFHRRRGLLHGKFAYPSMIQCTTCANAELLILSDRC